MESAELKEKRKRVRHCFRRREIYHQWIHSSNYCYTNTTCNVSGIGNYMFIGKISDKTEEEDIISCWHGYRRNNCFAIINREHKLVLVSKYYSFNASELMRDVPDDYQLFVTNQLIDNPNILSTGELDEVIKLHAKYLVEEFMNNKLSEAYSVLRNLKKIFHSNIDYIFEYDYGYSKVKKYCYYIDYNVISDFVKKYNVKKKDWYNKPFDDYIYTNDPVSWKEINSVKVPLTSIKKIITNTVFTKKEKLKLRQRYFYGRYCFGNNISIKEVESNWNKSYNREEFQKLLDARNLTINLDDRPELIYWQDAIKLLWKATDAANEAYIQRCFKRSEQNYNKALEELNEKYGKTFLEDWRNFKNTRTNYYVEYEKFAYGYTNCRKGKWVKVKAFFNFNFRNTILRLKDNIIETSRYAKVPLEDAIDMYRVFKIITKNDKLDGKTKIMHRCEYRNFKVGIFNLRAVFYDQKKTNNGELLDKFEYCIVIGCHYLWMDDFYDFVKYYNLSDKFGITINK